MERKRKADNRIAIKGRTVKSNIIYNIVAGFEEDRYLYTETRCDAGQQYRMIVDMGVSSQQPDLTISGKTGCAGGYPVVFWFKREGDLESQCTVFGYNRRVQWQRNLLSMTTLNSSSSSSRRRSRVLVPTRPQRMTSTHAAGKMRD